MLRSWFIVFILALLPEIFFGQPIPVKGYLLDQQTGKGIADVVVSDGYNVVSTNSKGWYSFFRHPSASFVFVSTPAGFRIAHTEGVPSFYTKLGEGSRYDFFSRKRSSE